MYTNPGLTDQTRAIDSEETLAAAAIALGARTVGTLSDAEKSLLPKPVALSPVFVRALRAAILAGNDPLGTRFCELRTPEERRSQGATYTPKPIVDAMVEWAKRRGCPARIVDPGAGSGRFLIAAGKAFGSAKLIAVELDPLAALLVRANLAVVGLAERADVLVTDFRSAPLGSCVGKTLYLGNPPYVRHHLIGERWKQWLTATAQTHGMPASQLAGLHVHFFLGTVQHAKAGDYGTYITASEWLDVNYGALVRQLFLGPLGGAALHVVNPKATPFADAQTTAAITCFDIGSRPRSVYLRRVESHDALGALEGGRLVRRERLDAAGRWTPLTYAPKKVPRGFVELGELCRVRRGQVTGDNDFWIAGPHAVDLPESVLFPTVTKARELYAAGKVLTDATVLRKIIDLPEDLDALDRDERKAVKAFIAKAKAASVHNGYIARHRRAWWSVGLYEPAPVLATYMARRPPGFVRNLSAARNINIAHGIYPRESLSPAALDKIVDHLSTSVSLTEGRTYAGGLTKFEPKEMERLLIPVPEVDAT
jgi:adenine-specific DNA-methyltransferase